jgi:hypothetical protein
MVMDKTNKSIIKRFRVSTVIEDVEHFISDIIANNIPIFFIEFSIEAIWSRGNITLELMSGIGDLCCSKSLVQILLPVRLHPIGHNIDSFLDISGVRGCEEISEILLKY